MWKIPGSIDAAMLRETVSAFLYFGVRNCDPECTGVLERTSRNVKDL